MPLMADWFRDAFLKAKAENKPQTIGDMLSPDDLSAIWEKASKLGRKACETILRGVEGDSMEDAIIVLLAVNRVRAWGESGVEEIIKKYGADSALVKVWKLCEAAFASNDNGECLKAMDEVAKSWKGKV